MTGTHRLLEGLGNELLDLADQCFNDGSLLAQDYVRDYVQRRQAIIVRVPTPPPPCYLVLRHAKQWHEADLISQARGGPNPASQSSS